MYVRSARQKDLPEIAKLAKAMNRLDGTYPPPNDPNVLKGDWEGWLLGGGEAGRWVARTDSGVVGHVSFSTPGSYLEALVDSLDKVWELGQFFVNPDSRGHGVGDALFQRAMQEARQVGKTPVLAVMSVSVGAKRFYEKHGMVQMGEFNGRDGLNYVFSG